MTPETLPDEMVEIRRVDILKLAESFEGNGSFQNRMISNSSNTVAYSNKRECSVDILGYFQMESTRIYGERPHGDGQLLSRVNHIITRYEF